MIVDRSINTDRILDANRNVDYEDIHKLDFSFVIQGLKDTFARSGKIVEMKVSIYKESYANGSCQMRFVVMTPLNSILKLKLQSIQLN